MIKIIGKIVKKLVFSFALIYSFDLMLKGFNVVVPINYYSVAVVAILGCPGLVMMAISFFLI